MRRLWYLFVLILATVIGLPASVAQALATASVIPFPGGRCNWPIGVAQELRGPRSLLGQLPGATNSSQLATRLAEATVTKIAEGLGYSVCQQPCWRARVGRKQPQNAVLV